MTGVGFRWQGWVRELNCWEAVVVAAIIAGVLGNATTLVNLYQKDENSFEEWLTDALTADGTRAYQPNHLLGLPVRGDIVLFDGLGHVAVATGEADNHGTQVYSFWPAPGLAPNQFHPSGTPTTMQVTTVEALGAWMNNAFGASPKITFGSPNWPALNQV